MDDGLIVTCFLGGMKPIQALIDRIRWDHDFGGGKFVIGYQDRFSDHLIEVPFEKISFDPGDHFAFTVVDAEGESHHVPYHRVRTVYRDGQLIWHRD